jgi:neurofibromin 1
MIKTPDLSYEIDPSRLQQGEPKENVNALKSLCEQLMESVLASAADFPVNFCLLCHGIRTATAAKFPGAELNAVGGLVFLRFLTPALVSPQTLGVCDFALPPPLHRGLLLASKALQAVANFAPFNGVKEAYMQCLNQFVIDSMPKLRDFLDKTSRLPEQIDAALNAEFVLYNITLPCKVSGSQVTIRAADDANDFVVKEQDLHALHRLLGEHLDKLGRELTSVSKRERNYMGESPASLFDRLTTLLAQLGDPPKADMRERRLSVSTTAQRHDNKFEELMSRYRDDSQQLFERFQARHIFYESNVKSKRPVFYYIARRYRVADLEPEQLFYFILATLKPHMRSTFDVVVDLTLFAQVNEPPMEIVDRFVSYLHPDIIANIGTLLLYNPSSWFKAFSKRIHRLVLSSKLHKKIKFVTFTDLQALLSEPSLPPSTMRLIEAKHEFNNATSLGMQRKLVPVCVKVGPSAIQMVSTERVKILGAMTLLYDFHSVANITEINDNGDNDTIVVTLDHGAERLALGGAEAEGIMLAITEIWQRHLLSQPGSKAVRKVIRPADVPGTLLNMALLNLGSPEPALRLASYNFLAAVTTTFNFHIGGKLLEATGIAIPQNNSNFIIKISEYLAENEPRLTLEFLDECVAGLSNSTTEQKHLCLEYMQPWLPNVKDFAAGAPEKTLKIIRGLVDVTILERELYPSLQAKVWYTIGQVDDLVIKVVEQFLSVAIEAGPGSHPATIMADAVVTLAAANVNIVARMVIDRMLNTLDKTSVGPQSSLVKHKLFGDIQVLCRFLLMMSFNDRLDVLNNLPDIFHTVTLILAVGPATLKASVYSILINVTQSLCTTLSLNDEAMRIVRVHMTEMIQPKFCLSLGISDTKTSSASVVFGNWECERVGKLDNFQMSLLSSVVISLWEILDGCAVYAREKGEEWKKRWMELAADVAFQPNPALQPRAFVTLGVIARQLPDGLLVKVLKSLAATLKQCIDTSQSENILLESILMCLTNLLRLVPGSPYLPAMFWVCVAILQVKGMLFPALLSVMETCLNMMDTDGNFQDKGIEPFLMDARTHAKDLCSTLDAHSAISFETSFSFGVSGVLTSGLDPMTPPATLARISRLVVSFLNVQRHAEQSVLSEQMLGYAAAALPIAEEVRENLVLPHVKTGEGKYEMILNRTMLKDNTNAVLLISFMCAKFERTDNTAELRFLYDFLAEAAKIFPEVFPLIGKRLQPRLQAVVTSSQDIRMVKSCHQILSTLVSAEKRPGRKLPDHFVEKLGFAGLFKVQHHRSDPKLDPSVKREMASTMMAIISQILCRFLTAAGEDVSDLEKPRTRVSVMSKARYNYNVTNLDYRLSTIPDFDEDA